MHHGTWSNATAQHQQPPKLYGRLHMKLQRPAQQKHVSLLAHNRPHRLPIPAHVWFCGRMLDHFLLCRSSADTGSDVLALGNPPSSLLPPLPVGTDNAPAASAQPPGHADEPAAELMGSSPDDEQPRPSVADEAAPGSGRKAGACGKVLVVAESLEEELFVAEAHRHDAEVSHRKPGENLHGLMLNALQ